jgi:dienelactone hydrolase
MRPVRLRSPGFGFLVVVSLATLVVAPARGEIIRIDPLAPPAVTLPPDEAARLQTLLSAAFPPVISDVSPDDRTILTATPATGVAFLDLNTKATVPVGPEFYAYQSLTAFRWRNPRTLVFVGDDGSGNLFLVSVARADGVVTADPLAPTGFPVSLSTNAGRLLVARTVETTAAAPGARPAAPSGGRFVSPFVKRKLATFKRPGPATFDAEEKLQSVRVTTISVDFAVFEIATGQDRPLIQVPPETALLDVEWSLDDGRLALVRGVSVDLTRGGVVPTESDQVQNCLGRLRPAENPFFTSSALDLFSLRGHEVGHVKLEATLPNGETFLDTVWSSDARKLMVQMWHPSTPQGRRYPTYWPGNASTLRFYSAEGKLLDTLDRREVESQADLLFFLSDDEAVILVPLEMSWCFYSYNLRSRQLRRLSTPPGTIYQVRSTPHSRELVYTFGSFQQPYEVYKIQADARAPRQLTNLNAAVAAENRIRADRVRFQLEDGARREGFLLQPKGGSFPPRNVPLIVWQQGGPTSAMTEEWGGSVEEPLNLLPNFGFALLVVPLPGRVGFGPQFQDRQADRNNFGKVDIDEQAEIAGQLVDRGYTSRPRLGITGCSYGGYFTTQSITRHPNAYAAANTQCSLLDLFNEFDFGFRPLISYLMGRTPDEDPAEYTKDSPVLNAARVKAPTLIFDGTEDFLPYTISQDFHDAINAAGTPADFYLFEGEGHGLSFFNSQFVAGQAQINWFRRYLAHD